MWHRRQKKMKLITAFSPKKNPRKINIFLSSFSSEKSNLFSIVLKFNTTHLSNKTDFVGGGGGENDQQAADSFSHRIETHKKDFPFLNKEIHLRRSFGPRRNLLLLFIAKEPQKEDFFPRFAESIDLRAQ